VVICSSMIRPHVRMIIARTQPTTAVLAHQEIHPQSHLRTFGSI
jgi:flagellar biosynthesis component FlhA